MNSDAVKATAAREEEMQRLGGLGAYRLQALQNLKLKTVVKVRHAAGTSSKGAMAMTGAARPPPFACIAAPCVEGSANPFCIGLQESHASSVHALVMNQAEPTCANLFATVGKDQATVYDGEHMGEHVGVVVHFTNTASEHAPGGELQAAAWLSAEGWSQHPADDACLAVAGADPNISGAAPAAVMYC
jgi:polycomb protein EED/COMPASS component SWD3